MRHSSPLWLASAVLAGSAALFLTACGNQINVEVNRNQKVVLHPVSGDHISWSNTEVKFLLPLCKEGKGTFINSCEVQLKNVKSGRFNYICKAGACTDPEVDVGTQTFYGQKHGAAADGNADYPIALSCVGGMIEIDPPEANADYYGQPVIPGKIAQWQGNGYADVDPVLLTAWTVTFDDTTACAENNIQDGHASKLHYQTRGNAENLYLYSQIDDDAGLFDGNR